MAISNKKRSISKFPDIYGKVTTANVFDLCNYLQISKVKISADLLT